MALVDLNLNPSDKQLRQFGWIAMIALPLLAFYADLLGLLPWPDNWQIPGGWGLGVFLGIVAMIVIWIVIARRLRRQIEPGFKTAQRQAETGKIEKVLAAPRSTPHDSVSGLTPRQG